MSSKETDRILTYAVLIKIHSSLQFLESETLSGLNDKIDALRVYIEQAYPEYPWKGSMRFFKIRELSQNDQKYVKKRRATDQFSPKKEITQNVPQPGIEPG